MINSKLLKSAIVKSEYTRPEIAEKMGISLYSLQKKINNKSDLWTNEVVKLVNILGLEKDEVMQIFFET